MEVDDTFGSCGGEEDKMRHAVLILTLWLFFAQAGASASCAACDRNGQMNLESGRLLAGRAATCALAEEFSKTWPEWQATAEACKACMPGFGSATVSAAERVDGWRRWKEKLCKGGSRDSVKADGDSRDFSKAKELMESGKRFETAARGKNLTRANIEGLLSRAEETYESAASLFAKAGDADGQRRAQSALSRVRGSYAKIKDNKKSQTQKEQKQLNAEQCRQLKSTIEAGKKTGVDVTALETLVKGCP